MNRTRVNVCLMGSILGARTFTDEILEVLTNLKIEGVITEGEPDSSCDRTVYLVFDDEDRSSRLERIIALKEAYLGDYFFEPDNSFSREHKKSNPSFLGKRYLVREKNFIFRVRCFVLDYHNRGPPNSKRLSRKAESWRAFFI